MSVKKYKKEHYELQFYSYKADILNKEPGWRKFYPHNNLQSENEANKWLKKYTKQNELKKLDRPLRIIHIVEEYVVTTTETVCK